MTNYTAEQFAAARFATHPDGRIAARVEEDDFPWVASDPGDTAEWFDDQWMADNGFVPLSESLPSAPTGEMIEAVRRVWLRSALIADVDLPETYARAVVTAALSAAPAPTNDGAPANITAASEWLIEHYSPDFEECGSCGAVRDRECAVHHGVLDLMADEEDHGIERDGDGNLPTPTTDENTRTTLTDGIDFAAMWKQEKARAERSEEFAARWKETAREIFKARRAWRDIARRAEWERDNARHSRDLWVQRQMKAEQERDKAREEVLASLADFLIERGARVTEDGEGER